MNKKITLIFNWKMNPCRKKDALKLFSEIKKAKTLSEKKKLKINFIVAPPIIYLNSLVNKNKEIKFSGQDIFYKNSGSYTGAISQEMLKDSGANYSIVGHWERRNIFGESDKDISQKINALLSLKMKAIVCVGEEERDDKGKFADILQEQIFASLNGVGKEDTKKILLAYEPIWAIGVGGKKVTEEILEQSIFLIKKILYKKFGDASKNIKIIYAGSVDETNILKLSKIFGIDGFLLGRAGLDSKIFTQMIKNLG